VTCRCIILQAALERRKHPQGKVCGECKLFSRARGVDELTNITHTYVNGTFAMTKEIINLVCDINKAPSLTPDIVGYCSANQELCADVSPACDVFEAAETQPAEKTKATVVGRTE
jgi:hypothetical protein